MFNRMVNITALEDFDEKQPLAVRTLLLETFQSLKLMGRYAKVYYCKLKLSSAVGDWRGNLDVSVRRSWKRYVKASREEFCKAKTPDSEYYYTTFQRKSETPRDDDPEAHPLKSNYRKADGAFGIRQRQKNHNRAYNVNEDEISLTET
ncbi:hypothetical protein PHMEG_00021514 [Phytophthora megakarya]|uniref:Uncharacterized protein n=1 Tax=Phytophthora megakarya TaxID=4795 RepID=A0A225VMC2_9STRA|nr:hypothetical protein PHMEG_00021514 [Phytophthora megakarya]